MTFISLCPYVNTLVSEKKKFKVEELGDRHTGTRSISREDSKEWIFYPDLYG